MGICSSDIKHSGYANFNIPSFWYEKNIKTNICSIYTDVRFIQPIKIPNGIRNKFILQGSGQLGDTSYLVLDIPIKNGKIILIIVTEGQGSVLFYNLNNEICATTRWFLLDQWSDVRSILNQLSNLSPSPYITFISFHCKRLYPSINNIVSNQIRDKQLVENLNNNVTIRGIQVDESYNNVDKANRKVLAIKKKS